MKPRAPRPATEKDARLHKIPDHYDLEQWDPYEKPIAFLGHVFDTNSLGKWIFDWTAQRYGGGSPMSDIAGDLWLLILHLPGMLRLSYEFLKRSTGTSFEDLGNYEMMRDFIEAGDHLMERLQRFLRDYEEPVSGTLDEKELDSRGKLFHEQPAESNRIDIDKREIASEFHNQLKSFASNLKECKTRYECSNEPGHRQVLKAYIDQGEIVNTSVQELIKASDGARRAVHLRDDGTPTQEVWNAFMRNFLRDDNQLQTTQDLMRHMDQWIYYYEADCSFAPKPFTFLGRDLGVYGLMNNLLNCADIVFGRHSPTTRPVRDFTRNLGQVADEVRRIREHESLLEIEEISRRWPAPRDTFNWFIEKAKEIYDMIRDLVTVCEAGIPAPYRLENGSVAYGAALSFMGALLRDGDEEQEIIEDR
ncbi:hypothetical protein SLS64_011464 [Diaporthe eres]